MYTTTTIRCADADSVAGEEAQIKTHLLGTQSFQLTLCARYVCRLCVCACMCSCMQVYVYMWRMWSEEVTHSVTVPYVVTD